MHTHFGSRPHSLHMCYETPAASTWACSTMSLGVSNTTLLFLYCVSLGLDPGAPATIFNDLFYHNWTLGVLLFVFVSETWSYCVAQAGLELVVTLLSQPLQCWTRDICHPSQLSVYSSGNMCA